MSSALPSMATASMALRLAAKYPFCLHATRVPAAALRPGWSTLRAGRLRLASCSLAMLLSVDRGPSRAVRGTGEPATRRVRLQKSVHGLSFGSRSNCRDGSIFLGFDCAQRAARTQLTFDGSGQSRFRLG